MNDSKRQVAQWLGYTGLIPFVSTAALLALGKFGEAADRQTLALVLLLYGAVILSFVGALPWAHAMQRAELRAGWMVWSVVPSLLAWVAMFVTLFGITSSTVVAALVLISGFGAQLAADFRLRRALGTDQFPDWFMRMRIHLTLGACASLSVLLFIR